MTMQDSGKGGAAAGDPGGAPRLDPEHADELAATFRPAWEVDEEPAAAVTTPSVSAPETVAEASKAATLLLGSRPPAPSSEALDSATSVKPASEPRAKAASTKAVTLASAKKVGVAADPFGAPAPPAPTGDATSAAGLATDELEALVPKRGKGMVYGAVGVALALAVGVLLKLALSQEPPLPKTTAATTTATIATPAAEIPPPPPKEELPEPVAEPAPKAAVRAAEPPPSPAAATPVAAAPPPKPEPKAAPAARPQPRTTPRSAPESAPPAGPKTAPKAPAGGIVRDNPF